MTPIDVNKAPNVFVQRSRQMPDSEHNVYHIVYQSSYLSLGKGKSIQMYLRTWSVFVQSQYNIMPSFFPYNTHNRKPIAGP